MGLTFNVVSGAKQILKAFLAEIAFFERLPCGLQFADFILHPVTKIDRQALHGLLCLGDWIIVAATGQDLDLFP